VPLHKKTVHILSIEDNTADQVLIRELFNCSRVNCRFSFVNDGTEAMAFLRKEKKYAQAPVPDFILLDLNLPGMDGRQVLRAIKQEHSSLRHIPVIVFSSSGDQHDVAESYNLHANCYFVKPSDLLGFEEVLHRIEQFWLHGPELCEGRACA
jgi:two-component system, chemotaxis family, response regulator Rcp1